MKLFFIKILSTNFTLQIVYLISYPIKIGKHKSLQIHLTNSLNKFTLQFTLQIVYHVYYPIKLGKHKSLQIFTFRSVNH